MKIDRTFLLAAILAAASPGTALAANTLTADIVPAHVSNNSVAIGDLS